MYKINEVALKTGISDHTLRYYEKEGILPPIERDGGGRRTYSEENIAWIELVTCLKQTHMPMKEIKAIISLSIDGPATIDKRKKILLEHRQRIEQQLSEIQDSIGKINKKIAFYDGAEQC